MSSGKALKLVLFVLAALVPEVFGASSDPTLLDGTVYTSYPLELSYIAARGIPADDSGLLSYNKVWGAMYSPRFQTGAGYALRITLVANQPGAAEQAFHAVEVAAQTIGDDGYVSSTLPAQYADQYPLAPADVLSAAAFYLADAGMGMLALENSDNPDAIVSSSRRQFVVDRLHRATQWLQANSQVLLTADTNAPNRLMIDGLAFFACGQLLNDQSHMASGEPFIQAALATLQPEGYFLEAGGHDTQYQSVSIRAGIEILQAGYADGTGTLRQGLITASTWMAGRIRPSGFIDSTGNSRTCGGGETFLGQFKLVSPPDVFRSLAYAGTESNNQTFLDAAGRISNWIAANQDANPCYAGVTYFDLYGEN